MAQDLASLLLQLQSGHTGGRVRAEVDPETMIPGHFDLPLGRPMGEELDLVGREPRSGDIHHFIRELGLPPAIPGGYDWNLPIPTRPGDQSQAPNPERLSAAVPGRPGVPLSYEDRVHPIPRDAPWLDRVIEPLNRRVYETHDRNLLEVPSVDGLIPDFNTPVYNPHESQPWDLESLLQHMQKTGTVKLPPRVGQ